LSQDQSEVIPRLCMIRTQPDSRFQWRPRAVDVARPPPRGAEMILGVE
jgi:hypothetical protein